MNEEIQGRLNEFVHRKGLRKTPQRDEIVRAIFSKNDHFRAEEIYDRVKNSTLGISRATVYRTLSLLVEADLLRPIDLGDSQVTYDPNFLDKPSHNHVVCIDCGKVLEFEDEELERLQEGVAQRLGFKAVRLSLKVEGSCEQLRKNGVCPNLIASRLSGQRLRKKR